MNKSTSQPFKLPPFWQHIPDSFVYPTQAAALSTIVVLTLCRLVVFLPLGWIVTTALSLLITMSLFKYASECLLESAHGEFHAPPYSMQVTEGQAWNHLILQFLLLFITVLAFIFGGWMVGFAVVGLIAYAVPAAIIILTMTNNLGQALNPGAWFEIIGRIGNAYVLLSIVCAIYLLVGAFAAAYFSAYQGVFLFRLVGELLSWFVMHYLVIATFHLLGYTVFQNAEALGHEIKRDDLTNLPNLRQDPDQELINETQALVEAGLSADARKALLEHIQTRGATTPAHEHYRRILKKDGDQAALLEHGRQFVAVLAAQQNDKRAVEVLAECLTLDPGFRADIADDTFRLASRASLMGQHALAVKLIAGFHERWPKHPDIVRNYLLAARLLTDKLDQSPQALKLLQFMQGKWPDHPQKVEIATLLAQANANIRIAGG